MPLSWDTATVAELFLKQGHPDRAVAIYRKVVAAHPEDAQAARRLAEIEAQVASRRGVSMDFQERMRRIVDSVPGAMACTIMGFDGIAIDTYQPSAPEIDVSTLIIEYSAAATTARRAAETLEHPGSVSELTVAAENLTAILRPLNDELFLAVVLGPGALTGKARYMMRVAAPYLAKELS